MTPESNIFLGNRVTDGTDTAASVLVVDGSGFATETITISGAAGTGQTVIVTLVNGSVTVNTPLYTIPNGQSAALTATALSNIINNTVAVLGSNSFIQTTTASTNTIPINALASGTGGNSITASVAITGSGTSATPNSPTALSGGAVPGSIGTLTDIHTGSYPNASTANNIISGYRLDYTSPSGSTSPVARLTLYHPDSAAQVFNNIIAYATVGGGYSAATFKTNLAAAINTGSSAQAPAQFWTFTSGSSTAVPLVGVYQGASGGTDGTTSITTQVLLGQDATVSSARTGIYALRTMLGAAQVIIPQFADCTAAQALASFCVEENCIGFIDLGGIGTSTTTAVTTKTNNNVNSSSLISSMEWGYYLDPFTGVEKLCSPSNTIAGTVASLNPWFSPLNKPTGGKSGLIATEWSTTQFPDFTSLEVNNICFIARENGNFVVWNDNCSDGTPIADARMRNYIAYQIQVIGFPFIGMLQSTAPNDPTRNDYFNAIKGFLSPMAPPPFGSATTPQINAFNVDSSGNTPTTIQGGFLIGKTTVQTLRGIRYVLNIILVGSQVVVQQAA
jgi:hypothetical protein